MDGCIFCGKNSEITKEHIIPKSIFSWMEGWKNLITLPSCKICNSDFWKLEEEFVHQLHLLRWIEKQEILGKIKRKFSNPKLRKTNDRFKERIKYVELNWERRMVIDMDQDIVEKCIRKISKWLFFNDFEERLDINNLEIFIDRKNNTDLSNHQEITKRELIEKLDWSTLKDGNNFEGYFNYKYHIWEDGLIIYLLTFYEDIKFYVIIS